MTTPIRESFIEFMPVSIFGSVMGLCGLSFAWHRAAQLWKVSRVIADVTGYVAIVSFILLSVCYLLKFIRLRSLVIAEFRSPASIWFFATYIICLLLLTGLLSSQMPRLAIGIWYIGVLLMLLFASYISRNRLDERQEPEHTMPVWILPIAVTLNIPIIGNQLPVIGIYEFSLMAFGIGSIFSIVLSKIILSRLIFQAPAPVAAQPAHLILTAPLALAFTVYFQLNGELNIVASSLLYFNLFFWTGPRQ
ncbi:hypothetical protein [Dyadobacter sp. 3J3]|uniref:SLAC1 family transporter n=1 Tax=Dyadobacter sp. 3J3 TaxID=2606600 RepID=UPI0013568EC7|nr:hypothetical protein [Dyadobacter sp. 3J3]